MPIKKCNFKYLQIFTNVQILTSECVKFRAITIIINSQFSYTLHLQFFKTTTKIWKCSTAPNTCHQKCLRSIFNEKKITHKIPTKKILFPTIPQRKCIFYQFKHLFIIIEVLNVLQHFLPFGWKLFPRPPLGMKRQIKYG